jgi:8-oxo-dGTP pyrophosphatase MutT (NUDIX family)|tara:strand:- start:184 stop:612 length:429 start_codon:yes stop_codon:yes gene_type:complete
MKKIYDRISAGGLVFKKSNKTIFFVICYKKNTDKWYLPKGTQELGEAIKDTAIREVSEETGLKVSIIQYLSDIEYSFLEEKRLINKKVSYYIMNPKGGSFDEHDNEFDNVIWATKNQCLNLLKYENEKKLVAATCEIVGKHE